VSIDRIALLSFPFSPQICFDGLLATVVRRTCKDSINDFKSIVGDATDRCLSFVADFLSPHIATLHALNDTISSFVIETKDDANHFGEFLSLGQGQRLCLTEANQQFHLSISRELCNSEVYHSILKLAEGDISIENVVGLVKPLEEILIGPDTL
jgi:hypothetical protein